jgi:thioredoxin-like negative regulator of GroEL
MPTLLVFRDGEPVAQIVGARSAARLREDLSPHLDWP